MAQITAILALNSMVAEIAPTDIPVLLIGESGTGKDASAQLIHRLSPRDPCSSVQSIAHLSSRRSCKSLSLIYSLCVQPGTSTVTLPVDNIQDLNLDLSVSLLACRSKPSAEGRTSIRLISSQQGELINLKQVAPSRTLFSSECDYFSPSLLYHNTQILPYCWIIFSRNILISFAKRLPKLVLNHRNRLSPIAGPATSKWKMSRGRS